MHSAVFRGLLLSVAIFVAGCATIAPVRNEALAKFDRNAGYRFENIARGESNSDSLFVILTFSGGGTRAASFSYGVLESLRDTEIVWEGQKRRLLDEVDIVSSVSGGSLPAAYYALFGDRIFEQFPEKVLYKNIQGDLIKRLFSWRNYKRIASPLYGRTDLMADEFSADFFDHSTYEDLLMRNRRPFLIVNSTDLALGVAFPFTQDQFDALNSDLSQYPIGNAVAASAAFPGLLTPLTVRNHEDKIDFQPPDWVVERMQDRVARRFSPEAMSYMQPGRPYIHLTDGGVSDNLGLLPIIGAIRRLETGKPFYRGIDNSLIKKVVIISVNAKVRPKVNWDSTERPIKLFHVLQAATLTPLGNFTTAEVEYMKLYLRCLTQERAYREAAKEACPDCVDLLPASTMPDVDYHFVEVAFDYLNDAAMLEQLNAMPTSFRLQRGQVDTLRKAAQAILATHPDYRKLVDSLR